MKSSNSNRVFNNFAFKMQYQLVLFVVIFATAHAQNGEQHISAASESSVNSEIGFNDDTKSKCIAYLNTSLSEFLMQVQQVGTNTSPSIGKLSQDILNKKVIQLMTACKATTISAMQYVTTESTRPKSDGFYIEQMIVQRIEINPRFKREIPNPPESTLASSASPSSTITSSTTSTSTTALPTTSSSTTEEVADNPDDSGKCPCRPKFEDEYNQLLEDKYNLNENLEAEISQLKEQLKSRNCSKDVQVLRREIIDTGCETYILTIDQLRTDNEELNTRNSDCEEVVKEMEENATNAKQDYETALRTETRMKIQFQNGLKIANKEIEELKAAELDFQTLLAQERSEKDALQKFIKTLEDKWIQFDLELKILLENQKQGNDVKTDLEKQLAASKQREDNILKEKIEALLEVDRLNNDIKTLNSDMQIMNKLKEVLQFNVSYLLEIGKQYDANIELAKSQVRKECEESKFILNASHEAELKKLENEKAEFHAKATDCAVKLEEMWTLVEKEKTKAKELEAEKDELKQSCNDEKSVMEKQLDNASVFTAKLLEEKKNIERNATKCAISFNNLEIQIENSNLEMLDLRKILEDKTKLQVDLENSISKYGVKCMLKTKFDNSNPPEQFSIVTNPPCRYDQ